MKRTVLLLAAGAILALAAWAQTLCHDEMICTPMGGCRWVAVCSSGPGLPPPQPRQCHDENICTPLGGCRWITVCN